MGCRYDKIVDMIKQLDLHDDGIAMNQKIKSIEKDFCNIVRDESMLSESMDYINHKVLSDKDASLKFALLFSSRNFDSLAMNDSKVRYKMLKILETNYQNADQFRKENKDRLYNSITLLGEYYHRVRLLDGSPIDILGKSLLGLLTQELSKTEDEKLPYVDYKLAKLILSQVTLNGSIMRSTLQNEVNLLLYNLRRHLIEVPDLKPAVKALLLMTLDLYYNNFGTLGERLEGMYTKYLLEDNMSLPEKKIPENNFDASETKKWSEQVNEEIGNEASNEFSNNLGTETLSESSVSVKESSTRSNNSYNITPYNSAYDEDRYSVHSDGGSIRLYSVSERLKYHQNGGDKNNFQRNYSFNNSRRSNSRNRGQYNGDNYQNKNNRNYNRPPRFSNNKNRDSWRNNLDNNTNQGGYRCTVSESRSSSVNRNVLRPSSSNYKYNDRGSTPDYERGGFSRDRNQTLQTNNSNHNRNQRCGSYSSLTSDSGAYERKGRRRNSRTKSQNCGHIDGSRFRSKDEKNLNDGESIKSSRNGAPYVHHDIRK